jgi:pyrimidine-nucleoside phosphorylase
MLYLADKGTLDECMALARDALFGGYALEKLVKMVTAMDGDASYIEGTASFRPARYFRTVTARRDGYIVRMDTERCGIASVLLGAGRAKKEDSIDYAAGIMLENKIGARVYRGDPLATLYAEREDLFASAVDEFLAAVEINEEPPKETGILLGRVE